MAISLKIDKFRQFYPFNSPNAAADYEQINYFVNVVCRSKDEYQEELFPKSKSWKAKRRPWTYGSFELNPSNTMCVAYGCIPSGRHCAFFEFNPGKLTPEGINRLHAVLGQTLFLEEFYFLKYGRIGHVEIACDVPGQSFHDFWFLDQALRSSDNAFVSKGTAYLGSHHSARSFTCYAKEKEQATHGIALAEPLLRMEATIKPGTALGLLDLPQIKNPFASLLVVDAKTLAAAPTSLGLNRFRKCLDAVHDPQIALHTASKEGHVPRRELCNRLQSCRPDWWRPEEIWAEHAPHLLDWAKSVISVAGFKAAQANQL